MKPPDAHEETLAVVGSGAAFVPVRAVTLVVKNGGEAPRQVRVDVPRFVIGAAEAADLRLVDNTVSREHLTVTLEGNGVRLRDEGSRNGTWIGKARITEVLLTGDATIRLGQTTIDVRLDAGTTDVAVSEQCRFGSAVGSSTTIRHTFGLLERAAQSDVSVLIEGESGVGKEILASALHAASTRAKEPFVVVDCGAISPALLESELFGHAKGAFTGANSTRIGLAQQADGGTLFLDEIGELPLDMQPKLLRLLEAREVRPVGSNAVHHVDIRVVAATNRSLAEAVSAKTFRQDLYYRLAVARVLVPPLRDRKEDVEPLAALFFRKSTGSSDPLPPDILAMFRSYRWPGNVRELRNVVERYAHLGATAPADLFGTARPGSGTPSVLEGEAREAELLALSYADARRDLLEQFDRRYFTALMTRAQGVVARAADLAGIARPSLYRILERIGHVRAKDDER